jgi:hypothetical protein
MHLLGKAKRNEKKFIKAKEMEKQNSEINQNGLPVLGKRNLKLCCISGTNSIGMANF